MNVLIGITNADQRGRFFEISKSDFEVISQKMMDFQSIKWLAFAELICKLGNRLLGPADALGNDG
jgi:hypothetical protein